MKKTLITFGVMVFMAMYSLPMCAWEPNDSTTIIHLTPEKPIIDPEIDNPRGPVYTPMVGQEDYTLYFFDEMDFFVNIYTQDDDGERTLEYNAFMPAQTTMLNLPTSFIGTYLIEVIRGYQHFWGEIEL
ncbi:MAG: hypothetical protein IJ197_09760 [Bacteroidaceae bacterium]|nr:hypothetical protein [Bacteroidaceae bacterium]